MDERIYRNDMTEIVQHLPRVLRWSYGMGHILNDICASMWFTYLLVFFHYVLQFDAILSGVVLLIGQVADAIATPFVGFHSDQTHESWLCRFGKRKTWHLLGTICVLLTFPFIFSPCIECRNAHRWAQLIYYAGFVVIFQFGWAAVQISHLSLVPELTLLEHERTELIAIRYSFTVCSNVLVYSITWAILHIMGDGSSNTQIGPDDLFKFQKIVFIGLGIGLVTSVIFYIFVKEETFDYRQELSVVDTRTPLMLLKDLKLYQVAMVYMPTRLFVNLSQIFIPLYLHESLKLPSTSLATIPLTIFLSSFVTSLIIEKLNSKLGRKISFVVGGFLGICACIWIRYGSECFTSNIWYLKDQIYPLSLLLGSGGSIMLVTSLGIAADYIGQHTENSAFVYGSMSFTDKLSNGLAVVLIQQIKSSSTDHYYYRDALAYACGGAALLALITVSMMKPFAHNTCKSVQRD